MKINLTRAFKRQLKPLLKKYTSLATELKVLESELLENPAAGIPIKKNIYKIRLAISSKGKGKSGGMRIITFVEVEVKIQEDTFTVVHLIAIYDKSEINNLTDAYLKDLIEGIEPTE